MQMRSNQNAAAASTAFTTTGSSSSSSSTVSSFEKSDDPTLQNRMLESVGDDTEDDLNIVPTIPQQRRLPMSEQYAKAFKEKRVVYMHHVSEFCLREDVQRFFSGLNIEDGMRGIIPVYNRSLKFNNSYYVIFETEEHATRATFRRNTMLGAHNINVVEANEHGFAEAVNNIEPIKGIWDRGIFVLANNFPNLESDDLAIFLRDFEVDTILLLKHISPLRFTKAVVSFSTPEETWRAMREKNRCFFKSHLMEISPLK